MPKYVVGATDARGVRVGNTDHKAGDEVTYLGSPINGLLKPVNEVARLIVEYHNENHAHPDLPICWRPAQQLPVACLTYVYFSRPTTRRASS